ncbi:hypothetical protein [Arthrobacter gyeryongensis]|uniref:hypothetical protein n=1 Tax=Arthrobacter gyeryongensis TaxID=1650592 RepID=UPI0031E623D1
MSDRKAHLFVDVDRYISAILIFGGVTLVLMITVHRLVLWLKKRTRASTSRPGK